MIKNLSDLANFLGVEIDQIRRRVYNDSDCGVCFAVVTEDGRFDSSEVKFSDVQHQVLGINLGSIVEGSEAEFSVGDLMFPFSEEDFESAIQYLEDVVDDYINENKDEDED